MLTLTLALSLSALVGMTHFETVQAATNVNGIITADITWTAANSPYLFTAPVGIPSGVTLTIDPGVTVNLGMTGILVSLVIYKKAIIKRNSQADKTSANPFNF